MVTGRKEHTAMAEQRRRTGEADAGHRLRAPDALHAFNRYEVKYLVDEAKAARVREEAAARMRPDGHAGAGGGYQVWSLYYDTDRLRFYREKIEGLRFRRKLRVRAYGPRHLVGEDTPVSVEIKQRVDRVTQKRRVMLPYRQARELCDRRVRVERPGADGAFTDEVLDLMHRLELRPAAMTGYVREAYVGAGADLGLRLTLDHRVRGRDRDFDLGAEAQNRFIVPPHLAVLEVKANERVPYWVTDLAARLDLQVVRVSKYCQSIEAHGLAPRSVFHVPVEDPVAEARPAPVHRAAAHPAALSALSSSPPTPPTGPLE
ncbi:polyphosphate polymerase domain-containing protein [Nocardiopsis composta]